MPHDNLIETILEHKRKEVSFAKKLVPENILRDTAACRGPLRSLKTALTSGGHKARVIAEIKRSSPKAMLKPINFDLAKIAKGYEAGGAVALSVLTDTRFFSGAPIYIPMARSEVTIPVLRKDFIIDSWQVAETAALGADAILLMATCLDGEQLVDLYGLAMEFELEPLIEIHTEDDWKRVEPLKPAIIGINNRNFHSKDLSVNTDTTMQLAPVLPDDVVVVSESGIAGVADIEQLVEVGVDGFLIGTAFMTKEDPGASLANTLSQL